MLCGAYGALWIVKSGDLAVQILTHENGDMPWPMQCSWNIYGDCIGIVMAVHPWDFHF